VQNLVSEWAPSQREIGERKSPKFLEIVALLLGVAAGKSLNLPISHRPKNGPTKGSLSEQSGQNTINRSEDRTTVGTASTRT
jgi:hypothetical protein